MNLDACIVICSRPDSKRLPRKAFRLIAGVPAIEHILHRLSSCGLPVVLAVPTGCADYDYLPVKFEALDLRIYRGHPDSPLHRTYDALQSLELKNKWIVRITHDDILIDQRTMLQLVEECDKTPGCGYGISPAIVEGAGVEVFRRENLEHAAKTRTDPTEFISYFVKTYPFSREVKLNPRPSVKRNYRLTMDYQEDADVLDLVLKQVPPFASLDRIVEFIDQHPYVMNLNKQPLVTLYTCAYNAEKYISKTIESVLYGNGLSEFEYLVIDDGSSDKTMLSIAAHSSNRNLKVSVNEGNRGLASSSNKAIDLARGKYIIRVDADDWIVPGAVDRMMAKLEKDGSGIIYANYYETDEAGNIVNEIEADLHHHAGCALMEKRLINEIRFTGGLKHFDSMDLYLRIKNKCQISYIHEPLWYYRRHQKNWSSINKEARKQAKLELGLPESYTTTTAPLIN